MKNLIIIFFAIISVNNSSAQIIDSVYYSYNNLNQELTGYVEGEFFVGATNKDIIAINDSILGDTVYINMHFLPCQTFPLHTPYDTTFIKNIVIPPGTKTIKTLSYWDSDNDSNSCYFNPNAGIVDTAFFNLSVSIGIEEYINSNLLVYPNPTTDRIIFSSSSDVKIEDVELYNSYGHSFGSTSESIIDIFGFDQGIYILSIRTNLGTVLRKIIKK